METFLPSISLLSSVCLDRQTGSVSGYYYDPNSTPFQYLSLESMPCERGGMSFGSYVLC